ncbi:MAG: hypothetical protein AB7T49_09020 [Oligoflexales bacterium]
MKVFACPSLAQAKVSKQVLSTIAGAALALSMVGCNNYTSAPLCNDENSADIPDLSGTYTVSVQDTETFEVETKEIVVSAHRKGVVSWAQEDGSSEESRLCGIDGRVILESFSDDVGGYKQSQIYVTSMGITESPIMFNKPSLDAAGITNSIFAMPESVRDFLGKELSGKVERALTEVSGNLGLMVDPTGRSPEEILSHAETSSFAFTYLRKIVK